MVGTLDKPKLTRSILENHGIHYHEDVYVPQDETRTLAMPVHVHKLREALTEFSNVRIMDNRKGMFMDQGMGLQAAYEDRGINASGWNLIPPDSTYDSRQKISDDHEDWKEVIERIENNFYDSKDIASDARSLDYEAESGWMKFLRDHFFKRFKRKRYGNDSDEQHKKRYVAWKFCCFITNDIYTVCIWMSSACKAFNSSLFAYMLISVGRRIFSGTSRNAHSNGKKILLQASANGPDLSLI